MDEHRRSMKIMKAKSITAMILFLALSLALSGIVSAQITQITENTHEDCFPRTAGGYVVWQAYIDFNWEIFLYNANDNTGPFQITDNTYDDISPRTDGKYVTWAAGSAPFGEIFIYDIATSTTTQLTFNNAFDAHPKVFNGLVVWVSKSVGDYGLEPGDIFLYDVTDNTTTNVSASALVDPNNIYDDYSFRFDGQQILWFQNKTPLDDKQEESFATYLYDLATGSIYRYYTPVVDEEELVPYLYDLNTGAIDYKPEGLTLQDDPQADGDFRVSIRGIRGGDREIELIKGRRGDLITANDIEDSQPSIGGNIVAWKGDRGNDAEIYIYEIPHLTLVSPEDGSEFHIKEFLKETPVFVWESSEDYIGFKIQFSTVASFEGKYTLTFPESDDAWLNEPSFTVGKWQAWQLNRLRKGHQPLYWRVLAQDRSGNEKISQTRHIFAETKKGYVKVIRN